jgi:hypothetical protein
MSNSTDFTRRLNEDQSADKMASKSLSIDKDNQFANIVLVCLALVLFLMLVAFVVCCTKFVMPKMPRTIRNLGQKIKAKLMWSSILRYATTSYLSTAIICMLSLVKITVLDLKD